jgi:signal transduction histidine kinase
VRELAVAMGGDARVEPVDSVGTRFVVTFPAGVS